MLAELLPKDCLEYREPFLGGGSMYFHLRNQGYTNNWWLNDIYYELMQFWWCVQSEERCAELYSWLMHVRRMYSTEQLKELYYNMRSWNEFESSALNNQWGHAYKFFITNRCSFSGGTEKAGFSKDAAVNRFTKSSIDRLTEMPQALEGVKLTSIGYENLIQIPGDGVVLYLDPPYYKTSNLYKHHKFDHEQLAVLLKDTQHKFMLSYDDCPEIRSLYSWARILDKNWSYGMSNVGAEKCSSGSELVILNY